MGNIYVYSNFSKLPGNLEEPVRPQDVDTLFLE